jgi:hypothetical protein
MSTYPPGCRFVFLLLALFLIATVLLTFLVACLPLMWL